MATTKNDKTMYVLLVAAIVLGLWTTLVSVGAGHEAHNYRETRVAVVPVGVPCCSPTSRRWPLPRSRSTSTTLVGMLLFAIWPFTRLVHAFTAPLHYLFRPYIVYRSRDRGRVGPGPRGPGWARSARRDRDR